MATSIRDLLTAANDALDVAAVSADRSRVGVEALTTISAAAPILAWLRRDGVAADLYGVREHALGGLAVATRAVATASRGLPDGRAAVLLGAAGDVIGTLHHDVGRDDRWALALAIGDSVRRASTLYRTAGPSASNRHVDWSRRAAVLLARLGADHPPEPSHLIVQDRSVADPITDGAKTTLAVAAQSVDNVVRLLDRRTEPVALYQLKATTVLAETTAHYLAAIASAAHPNRNVAWDRVPHSWTRVRRDLGVFQDGHPVRRDGSDYLLAWAARGHDAIVRALGPADEISSDTVSMLTTADRTHLVEIANQLPSMATVLWANLKAIDGRAFARVTDLPRQERRIAEQIRGLPVVADGPDFVAAHGTLRSAELRSAQLASALPARIGVATGQRHLAVHYAAIAPGRSLTQHHIRERSARAERAVDPDRRRMPPPSPGR